jgi:hypothetical protein
MVMVLSGFLPARMVSSQSWNLQLRTVRSAPSARRPAPLPSGARAGELEVLDGGVLALDHPDGLAAGVLAGGRDPGPALAHAADGQVAGLDEADVPVVLALGVDLDGVAVLGGLDGLRGQRELLARADLQLLAGVAQRRQDRQHGGNGHPGLHGLPPS